MSKTIKFALIIVLIAIVVAIVYLSMPKKESASDTVANTSTEQISSTANDAELNDIIVDSNNINTDSLNADEILNQ